MQRILIIDDDTLVSTSLRKVLVKLGFETECTDDIDGINDIINSFNPHLVLLDIYLSTHSGIDVLKEFKKNYPDLLVIMITGYADIQLAVTALKLGAYDFLLKPIDIEHLKSVLHKGFEQINLKYEVQKLHSIMDQDHIPEDYFGKSARIQRFVKSVVKLAESSDTTILLEGESGTGKEVFAKFIHQRSPRKHKPFIQINCATIPKDLAESELFGHERGAFTGASAKTKLGKFELADGGTILLDEIGELSPDLQTKLLRVLQEKKFFRLGGEKEISVNVRVLAATNKNLEKEVDKRNFREDLYFRLNVARVVIPPLRERKEDISYLVYSFIKEFTEKFNKKIDGITPEAMQLLVACKWKGNIRELKNVMERAILLLEGEILHEYHFDSITDAKTAGSGSSDEFILNIPPSGIKAEIVLKELIHKTLKITKGNQVKAAKILGLSRSKLRYRMEQLGIEVTKQIR